MASRVSSAASLDEQHSRKQRATLAAQQAHARSREAEARGRQRFADDCEALAPPNARKREEPALSPETSSAERSEETLEGCSVLDEPSEHSEEEDSEDSLEEDHVSPQIPGFSCDWYDESMDVLANYGSRPGDWQPSGGDWDGWGDDEAYEEPTRKRKRKPRPPSPDVAIAYCRGNTRVGWPAVDNFCTSCQHIRPKQRKLSSLETREDGLQYFVHERYCDECVRALAEL